MKNLAHWKLAWPPLLQLNYSLAGTSSAVNTALNWEGVSQRIVGRAARAYSIPSRREWGARAVMEARRRRLVAGSVLWIIKRERAWLNDGSEDNLNLQADKKVKVSYAEAEKNYLLYSPPAVLTIHLKRFQQLFRGFSKLNTSIKFPLLLDMAPFTSAKAQGLSTQSEDEGTMGRLIYLVWFQGRSTCCLNESFCT